MARKAPKINKPRENPVETKSVEHPFNPVYQSIENCCAELGLSIAECDLSQSSWYFFDGETSIDRIRLVVQTLLVDAIVNGADETMIVPINRYGVPVVSILDKVLKAQANLVSQENAFLGMTSSAFGFLSIDNSSPSPLRVAGFDIGIIDSKAFPLRPSLPYEHHIKSLAVYYSPDAIKVLVSSSAPTSISVEGVNNMGCGYIELEV